MKKVLWALLSLVLILLVIYTVRYYFASDDYGEIPADATAVIDIDVRKIEQYFLHDFIQDPFSYFTSEQEDVTMQDTLTDVVKNVKEESRISSWIGYPGKNLLLYSQDDNYRSWRSTSIPVKDMNGLQKYLEDKGYENNDTAASLYCKRSICLRIENDEIVIIWGESGVDHINNRGPHDKQLTQVNIIPLLEDSDHDVTFVNANGEQLFVDFNDGEVSVEGDLKMDIWGESSFLNKDRGILQVSGSVDKERLSHFITQDQISKFQEFTKLKMDSIMENWDGRFHFNLTSFTSKKDTITTFEYDDDFNKIEKESVQVTTVPSFQARFFTEENLMPYLIDKKAVVVDQRDTILAIFPLIRTMVSSDNGHLTFADEIRNLPVNPSSDKFHFSWDVKSYNQTSEGSSYHFTDRWDHVESINISISADDHMSMNIKMMDDGNAITSLIRSF